MRVTNPSTPECEFICREGLYRGIPVKRGHGDLNLV